MPTTYMIYDNFLQGPLDGDPLPGCLAETIRTYQTAIGTIHHELIAGEGPYSERFRILHTRPDDLEEVMYLTRDRVSPLLEDALTMLFEACEICS